MAAWLVFIDIGGCSRAPSGLYKTPSREGPVYDIFTRTASQVPARLDHSNAYVTHNGKVRRRVKL